MTRPIYNAHEVLLLIYRCNCVKELDLLFEVVKPDTKKYQLHTIKQLYHIMAEEKIKLIDKYLG